MELWPRLKDVSATLVAAGVVTFLLCQPHLGFGVMVELLVLVPWTLASIWLMVRQPETRTTQGLKIGVWVLSVAVVAMVHYHLATETRANAQAVVDAVLAYHTVQGAYPADAEAVGYSQAQLRTLLGMGGYMLNDKQPTFFYASTFMPFETVHFDFEKRVWTQGY